MADFSRPEDVIDELGLYGPMTIADFGCHAGFWTIPMAQSISPDTGIVFALDIQQEPLRLLRKQAHDRQLHNIRTLRADLETRDGSHLKEESIDLVLVANILFQSNHKEVIIHEAWRVLKLGGRLVIVEWDTHERIKAGPSHEYRIPKATLMSLAQKYHFSLSQEFKLGSHHYGIILKKMA